LQASAPKIPENNPLLLQTIDDAVFTVVDVETTGMHPVHDRLTDIALYLVRNGKVIDNYASLINPLVPIPSFITAMTGISNSMVQNAPHAWEVIPIVTSILRDTIFVAHNAQFDWGFVTHTAMRERNILLDNPVLCTVKLSRRLVPEAKKHNLDDLSRTFEIYIDDRHRAEGDAYATTQIFIRIMRRLRERMGPISVAELLDIQRANKRKLKRMFGEE